MTDSGMQDPDADLDESPAGSSLTGYVAEFVTRTAFGDLPASVVEASLASILDGLGLALAGSISQPGRLLGRYLHELGVLRADGSTILGRVERADPRFAALANGLDIHADDYDDTQLAVAADRVYGLLTHPTAPVLPAVLALAERDGRSGADLVLAYNLGVEVECKVAEAINPRHYQEGFHTTGTVGCFGSAAGASALLGLDEEATRRALSIAASQAAGLRENFGTMTKPLHAGRAAEAGVVAAQLAALGWSANPEILDAPRGFFRAAGGGYARRGIEGKLASPWAFDEPGVSIKPHPSGSLTHPAMTALAALIAEHRLAAEEVRALRVGTSSNMPNALIYHRPTTALEGKFSMEFCLAVLLLDGRAGLAEFTDATVHRPDVQAMIERVDFHVDKEAEAAGYDKMRSIVTVELANGDVLRRVCDFAKGSPSAPMSFDEVAAKFAGCAAFAGWPADRADRVVELVAALASLGSLDELLTCLRPG
ncbi:MAG TPA: MmgE/PrpD family protein [Acidimicrobiales bacterium]|nr:MmgE/PrpD family protein [Acidimicrobiales bacterium]